MGPVPQLPFVESRPAWPVLLLTSVIMLCGVILPFTPLGARLGLTSLPPTYFGWLAVILLSYSVLTQMVKAWYVRAFGTWL